MRFELVRELSFISIILLLVSFLGHSLSFAESWDGGGFDEDRDMNLKPDEDIWERQTAWFYNRTDLDPAIKYAGDFSAKLELMRDSVSLITAQYFRVEDGKSYLLCGWVRTEGLTKSVARMSLHWYSKEGIPIGVIRTKEISGTSDWLKLTIRVPEVPKDARFVRISVDLEGGDIRGKAWFDSIYLLEEVRLIVETPEHPGNLFNAGEDVRFRVKSPALDPGLYDVEMAVYEFNSKVGWSESKYERSLNRDIVVSKVRPLSVDVVVRDLAPGHYVGAISLFHKEEKSHERKKVAERRIKFGVKRQPLFKRFLARDMGIDIGTVRNVSEAEARVISGSGIGMVKVNVWDKEPVGKTYDDFKNGIPGLLKGLAMIRRQGLVIQGAILHPPFIVEDKRFYRHEDADIFDLFVLPSEVWQPYLMNTVEEFSRYVSRWQLGRPGSKDLSYEQIDVAGSVCELIKEFSDYLSPGVGYSGLVEDFLRPSTKEVSFVSLLKTTDQEKDALWTQAKALSEGGKDTQLFIELEEVGDEPSPASVTAQVGSFIKKVVEAKMNGNVDTIYIGPFKDSRRGLFDEAFEPNPAHMTLMMVADVLGGQVEYLGDISDEPGVKMHAFVKMDRVVCVYWSEKNDVPMDVYFGHGVKKIDLMGRSVYLDGSSADESERQAHKGARLIVSEEPAVLVVKDKPWLLTQLSFRPMVPSLYSRSGQQELVFAFKNEFEKRLTGRLSIEFPHGWVAEHGPIVQRDVEVEPGDVNKQVIKVVLPRFEVLGQKEVWVNMNFDVEGQCKFARFRRRIHVVSDIILDVKTVAVGDQHAIAVRVENGSNSQLWFRILVNVFREDGSPLFGFERRPMPLHVGHDWSYRFSLPAGFEMQGKRLEVILCEEDGDRFLNIQKCMSESGSGGAR